MAAGNMFSGTASIAASGTFDIKPGSGEWVIHNIRYNNQMKASYTDGTNVVDYYSDNSQGSMLGLSDHANSSGWVRITNTGSGTLLIAYDGMQTA